MNPLNSASLLFQSISRMNSPTQPTDKMCINMVLPPENLLATFKRLEAKEMVKAGRVCKLWSAISNENVKLWKNVNLEKSTLKALVEATIRFDEKSGSALQEVSFVTEWDEEVEGIRASYQLNVQIFRF